MHWIQQHWALLLPLTLGVIGVWLLMPGRQAIRPLGGLAALGGLALSFQLIGGHRDLDGAIQIVISAICLIAAVLMITNRNPVYAALWFAVVTLSVCGLFMLQSAPFLAAASVIVYAGAIIVTFLFVIMLAQQSGAASYDQSSRQPLFASIVAFTLLGLMFIHFDRWGADQAKAPSTVAAHTELVTQNIAKPRLSHVSSHPIEGESIGQLRGLGRSLFTDFLFAVEIGGTLLLIASIGAIALAPRRAQGTL